MGAGRIQEIGSPCFDFEIARHLGRAKVDRMSQTLDVWVWKTEELVVPAVEAMPEEKYSFAPMAGEFTGVRTFGQLMKQLVGPNYQLGALILGEKPAHNEHGEAAPATVKTKVEIVEYLKGPFAHLHKVAATIDERTRPGRSCYPVDLAWTRASGWS